MSRKARVRAGALTVCAAALCSMGASSCGTTGSSSVTASGTTLDVYVSSPPGAGPTSMDIVDAERLAFQQDTGTVGKFKLRLVPVGGAELSDNARTAIENTSAIAYLGETMPGDSAQTLGITNAQDLLQVSPNDTALELTQGTSAISNTPDRYYESLKTYGRTFARVVPSTALEAKAQIQEMKSLGVSRLYVAGDGSPYGLALAAAVKADAAAGGVTIATSSTGADGMFYAGVSANAAVQAFTSAANSNPKIKLFGPSAIDDPVIERTAARNVYVSSPGTLPKDMSAGAQKFLSDFKAAYNHTPAPEAIYGFEAMQAVLYAVHQAGSSANNRATVVEKFFAIRNRQSVLGTYSINANGDTNLGTFVFSRLKGGALVPFTSVQVQG